MFQKDSAFDANVQLNSAHAVSSGAPPYGSSWARLRPHCTHLCAHDGGRHKAQLHNALFLFNAQFKKHKKRTFYFPALGTGAALDNKNDSFFETRSRDAKAI